MNKIVGVFILVLAGCAGHHKNTDMPEIRENIEIHVHKDALAIKAFNFRCLAALQKALQRADRNFPIIVSFSDNSLEYEALKVIKAMKKQGFQNVELITGKSGWALYPPVSSNEELESCKP